jgi:pimeloyl-ACP methyl ester carboxylesterase
VKDGGAATTGSLKAGLERAGHTVKDVKYGWMGGVRVRMCNASVGRVMADMADTDSYLVAHSNGAAIAYLAALHAPPNTFKKVFLINPALDSNLEIPNVNKVHVLYAQSDPWTRLARWIPFSRWGRQGQVGFTGDARKGKYTQTELDEAFGKEMGHSGVFETQRTRQFVEQTINWEITHEQ